VLYVEWAVVLQRIQQQNNELKFRESNDAVLLIAVNLVNLAITNSFKYCGSGYI
jgi:hypothetical protein